MPDDKTKVGPPDTTKINIHEPYEVQYWHKKLGCTPDELKHAVIKVGPSVENVKKELGN